MALGSAQMTITTGANLIPTIWSKELQVAREANLVIARLVKRFDADVKRMGDTVKIPKISNLTANSKSANTQVTLNAPTENVITLSINAHYECSFLIEDNLTAKEAYDLSEEYKHKSAYALASRVDTDALALNTNITQSQGTTGVPPTDIQLLRAVQYLDDANAPLEDRFFVMKPSLKNTFLQQDKFVSQLYVENFPVQTGLFGQRYGLPFYMSTNLPNDASGNPINLIAHKEVYAVALQKDIVLGSQYKLEYLGTLYSGQVIYGVITYRADHGCLLLSN